MFKESFQESEYVKQEETGLGKEVQGEEAAIPVFADEGVRKFTKEYSQHWRDIEAKKIRRMRQEISEKKEWISEKNELRSSSREKIQSEIVELERQLSEEVTILIAIDEELDRQANEVWFRFKELFGLAPQLPQKDRNERIENVRQIREVLEQKKQLLAQAQDIVLHESELNIAKNELKGFYREQKGVKDIFEDERENVRSVERVAFEKQVLFLHGLPTGVDKGNTTIYNQNVNTESMGVADRAKLIIGLEPTISVSTKHVGEEGVEREQAVLGGKVPVFMQVGLILNGGNILSAYAQDAGTVAETITSRFSKDDKNLRSAVQEDFPLHLDKAIEHRIESGEEDVRQRGWNELVVQRPSVAGSFAYLPAHIAYEDFLTGYSGISEDERRDRYVDYLSEKMEQQIQNVRHAVELSAELGLPAYAVKKNGEILNLLNEIPNPVSQEEVLRSQLAFSTKDRIAYIGGAIGFSQNERMSDEMKNRMRELEQLEGIDEENEKIRERNKTKAVKILEMLKNVKDHKSQDYIMRLS